MIARTNGAWTAESVEMVVFAMYRVLLQSGPDALNEVMVQIPNTCSLLLPLVVAQYVGYVGEVLNSLFVDSSAIARWICFESSHVASYSVCYAQPVESPHSVQGGVIL